MCQGNHLGDTVYLSRLIKQLQMFSAADALVGPQYFGLLFRREPRLGLRLYCIWNLHSIQVCLDDSAHALPDHDYVLWLNVFKQTLNV